MASHKRTYHRRKSSRRSLRRRQTHRRKRTSGGSCGSCTMGLPKAPMM